MRSPLIHTVLLLLAASLTGGCTGPIQQSAPPAPSQLSTVVSDDALPDTMSAETLYQLLVAEFAGIRQAYPLSLQIYREQAFATRDPAIIARATRIASYLEAPAIAELARLWIEVEPDNLEPRALSAHYLLRTGALLATVDDALYLAQHGDPVALQALAMESDLLDPPGAEQLVQRLDAAYENSGSDLESGDPELAFALAIVHRQQGDLPAAEAWAIQATVDYPPHEGATLLLSQLLHQQGDVEAALALLERSVQNHGDSRRLRLQYARFLTDMDLELARDQISILAGQFPDDLDLQYTLALINLELGHREAAQKLLESLLHSPRHASNAHYQLGWLAEQGGYPDLALEHYQQVERGANLLPGIGRAVRLLSQSQGTAAARDYLHELRGLHPILALPLYQYEAELLLQDGAHEQAYQLLGDALQAHPDEIQLLYSRFVIAEQHGHLERIEANLRRILAQEPDNPTALNALGYSLILYSDRYEEARELIARALEQEPNNPAILDSMGWVYYQLGDYEQAQRYLEAAFTQLPDPEVAAHLGEVLWQTGARTEARQVWREGLKTAPDHPVLQETLNRLSIDDL